jgi:hypothetical protein
MHFSRIVVLVLLVVGVAAAQAQQSCTLKYKFDKGQTYRYADTILSKTTQEMMGQEMKMSNIVYAVTKLVTEEVGKEGGATLLMSSDTMVVASKNPRVDTTIVPVEMLHKRNRLSVSAHGDVLKREVVDSLKFTGFMRMAGGFAQRELFRFALLPEKPVTVGEKWTRKRTDTTEAIGNKGVNSSTYEYTLVGAEEYRGRGCLKITYSGKVTVTSKGSMMGMDVFTEGNGTMSGTFYFDEKAGVGVAEEGKLDLELTAAVTGQQNMTIPISQSATSKHVLLTE